VLTSDWYQQSVPGKAKSATRVTCVILPFIAIPGLIEQVFPQASVAYISLVPRVGAYSAHLFPDEKPVSDIPLLDLHTKLVQAYWATSNRREPWSFLEDDFAALEANGFRLAKGNYSQYCEVVRKAASQFSDSVEKYAGTNRADAIAVYGRGHWTMNAAAVAANRLRIPLYVVERGILPRSYIVDFDIPFTGSGSHFRSAWQSFKSISECTDETMHELSESSLDLYSRFFKNEKTIASHIGDHQFQNIIVGQCAFDYNYLHTPFTSPRDFVEHVLKAFPALKIDSNLCYRPHPLSLEEYPQGVIHTQFSPITIDFGSAWSALSAETVLYTWSSTLGLEANLVFDSKVNIMDPDCHYKWICSAGLPEKNAYIRFLNAYSIFQ